MKWRPYPVALTDQLGVEVQNSAIYPGEYHHSYIIIRCPAGRAMKLYSFTAPVFGFIQCVVPDSLSFPPAISIPPAKSIITIHSSSSIIARPFRSYMPAIAAILKARELLAIVIVVMGYNKHPGTPVPNRR